MEIIKLIGVLIVVIGFILKLDTLAVVVVAGDPYLCLCFLPAYRRPSSVYPPADQSYGPGGSSCTV